MYNNITEKVYLITKPALAMRIGKVTIALELKEESGVKSLMKVVDV